MVPRGCDVNMQIEPIRSHCPWLVALLLFFLPFQFRIIPFLYQFHHFPIGEDSSLFRYMLSASHASRLLWELSIAKFLEYIKGANSSLNTPFYSCNHQISINNAILQNLSRFSCFLGYHRSSKLLLFFLR